MDTPKASQIQTGTQRVELIQSQKEQTMVYESCPIPMDEIPMDCYPEVCSAPSNQVAYGQPMSYPITQHQEVQQPQQQIQKSTYHIMDLFWLINSNYKNKELLKDGEAEFITVSFNMDFGNLRIAMYSIPEDALHQNVVFQQSLKRLVAGTIYPASCMKITSQCNSDNPIVCMEQLITNTGEQWQRERPITVVHKSDELIKVEIIDPSANNKFFFNFSNWQLESFINACQFVYTQGFQLHGQNIIRNR